jgi:hypothetical protein
MPGLIPPFDPSSPQALPLVPRTLLGASLTLPPNVDTTTIKSITTLFSAEMTQVVPSGFWGPHDTDSGYI